MTNRKVFIFKESAFAVIKTGTDAVSSLGKLTEIIFEEMRSLEQNLTFESAKMFAERDVNCVKRHGRRSFYLQKMRVTKSASVNRPI